MLINCGLDSCFPLPAWPVFSIHFARGLDLFFPQTDTQLDCTYVDCKKMILSKESDDLFFPLSPQLFSQVVRSSKRKSWKAVLCSSQPLSV